MVKKKYVVCYDGSTNKIACFTNCDSYPGYKVSWKEDNGTFYSDYTGKMPLITIGDTFEQVRDFVDKKRNKILERFPNWVEYDKKVKKNEPKSN